MVRRLSLVFVAAVLVASALSVAAAPAQDKVLVVRKAKVGDVSRSTTDVTMAGDVGGQQISMSVKAIQRSTITAIGADGSITSREEAESTEMVANGQTLPTPQQPPTTVVTRPDGSLVSHSDATADGIEGRMFNATSVQFSDKPVGVGDTWSREVKADARLGTHAGIAEFKAVAFEKVGSVDTVKISIAFRETASTGSISTAGTAWIEKSTGDTVKAEYEFKNVPMPQLGIVSGMVRVARIGG